MEIYKKNNRTETGVPDNKRREFLKKGIFISTLTGITGMGLMNACMKKDEEEVTPSEDLMREHGVLNRILLIYDHCRKQLINQEKFPIEALNNSAQIIRTFIEDYHEKLEENYLFPRFEKANVLTDLVKILRIQHHAGRTLTDEIIQLGKMKSAKDDQNNEFKFEFSLKADLSISNVIFILGNETISRLEMF